MRRGPELLKVQLPFSFVYELLSFSKIKFSITSVWLIRNSHFALNSFFFRAIVNIVFENALVNPKMGKNAIFFNNIFGYFGVKIREFCRLLSQLIR